VLLCISLIGDAALIHEHELAGAEEQSLAYGTSLLAIRVSHQTLNQEPYEMFRSEEYHTHHRLIPDSGCQYTFLDIGANSGDTVNIFIHADDASLQHRVRSLSGHWDPMNPTVGDFDYGPWQKVLHRIFKESKSSPHSYCVIGLDANKAWSRHYRRFQKHHASKVQHLGMHSGIALGRSDGAAEFQCATADPVHGFFADGQPDAQPNEPNQYACVVETRSLPSILQELKGQSGKVLIVKMDPEFAVNTVLPAFLHSGAIDDLAAAGVHIYLVVDTQHMNKRTKEMWESRKSSPMVTLYDLTCTN